MEWLCGNHCPCCGATHPDVCRGLEMCLAVAEASRHSNVWRRWWGHLSPSCPMFPSSSLPIPSSQEPPLAFRPDGLILTPSVSPASQWLGSGFSEEWAFKGWHHPFAIWQSVFSNHVSNDNPCFWVSTLWAPMECLFGHFLYFMLTGCRGCVHCYACLCSLPEIKADWGIQKEWCPTSGHQCDSLN